jgi:hypothetical protein
MSSLLEKQNQVIISLLARSTIGKEHIASMVTSGKKKGKARDYLRAYNALDGSKSITEIANIVGVTKQNMAQVMQTWEDEGIVYNAGTASRSSFYGLMRLPI